MTKNVVKEMLDVFEEFNIKDYSIKSKDGKLVFKFIVDEANIASISEEPVEEVQQPKQVEEVVTKEEPVEEKTEEPVVVEEPVKEVQQPKQVEEEPKKPEKSQQKSSPKEMIEYIISELGPEAIIKEIKDSGYGAFCKAYGLMPSTFRYHYNKMVAKYNQEKQQDLPKHDLHPAEEKQEEPEVEKVEIEEVPESKSDITLLYNGRVLTELECSAIRTYLTRSAKPKYCAETLGITTKEFHNMVACYKRATNQTQSHKKKREVPEEIKEQREAANELAESAKGKPDGWQMLSDGEFHNIKNGVIIF